MDLPVLDKDEALGRLEGDLELWNEIREIWLEDVDNLFSAVSTALESRTADGLRRAAHALKGASANVGAALLAAAARDIELASPEADWPVLAAAVADLGRKLETTKRSLSQP